MLSIEPPTKCSKIGFEHCWETIPRGFTYVTSAREKCDIWERCKNCHLERKYVLVQREIKEWMYNERYITNE